ncbi:MAG: serine/threonine protein kinase [Deltaproteobacteria bacterium]|nr:serine/threonine protein kinase [Deltaproteobacteria bacterium]
MAFVLVGRDLAHFHLTRPLGSGAMSEVYLARDRQLDREVAVKVILDSVARKPGLVKRFEREARAAGRLDHPNVARVYFFGQTDDGAPFYTMELVAGWSLGDLIEARVRMRIDQLLSLLAQTCAGLQAALDAGIVHRDIKPANLMVGHDGVVKIVDFGLAKLSDDKSMTRTGTMLGTPYYMAPEIVRGEGGDWRADIYSLGVTFFHLLVGYPPYEADTPYGVMMKHINQPAPDLVKANPKLPAGLCNLITSMLMKNPEERPQSYKLLQASAMRLAADLSPRDLMTRLAWCTHESRNTVDSGGRCGSCQRPYGGTERAARFHVDLVGWHRNGADEDVAAYIGRAVGNPPEVIAPLLQELPFRAAFKSPRERARRMQRTFYEMGADVELVPADEKNAGLGEDGITELPFRPYWPPEVGPADGPGSSNLDTRTLLAKHSAAGQRGPSKMTLALAGLVVLVLVLVVALVVERNGGAPAIDDGGPGLAGEPPPAKVVDARPEPPTNEQASEDTGGWNGSFGHEPETPPPEPTPATTDEVPDAAAQPDEPATSAPSSLNSRRFVVRVAPGADSGVARGALGILEKQAQEIDELLGLRSLTLDVEFTDADHVDDDGVRQWTAATFAPELHFPIGGVSSGRDGSLKPASRLLYGRSALHRASGAACPPWLLVGLSLVLEQGPRPPTAVADLLVGDMVDPTKLDVTVNGNPPRTERLLHSYSSWIVSEQGWPKVRKMLESLERSGSVEVSFIQAFGRSPKEISSEWTAAVIGG